MPAPATARYDVPATRVSRRSLYSLVADEAYRDGRLDAREASLLEAVEVAFEVDPATAASLRRKAVDRYRAGKLGSPRRLDPGYLMEKVYAALGPAGPADAVEAGRVEELRQLLQVPREEVPAMREAAETHRLRWNRLVSSVGLAAARMEPDAPDQLEHVAPVEAPGSTRVRLDAQGLEIPGELLGSRPGRVRVRPREITGAIVHVLPGEAEEPDALSLSLGDVCLRLTASLLPAGVWEAARHLEQGLGCPVELEWGAAAG